MLEFLLGELLNRLGLVRSSPGDPCSTRLGSQGFPGCSSGRADHLALIPTSSPVVCGR